MLVKHEIASRERLSADVSRFGKELERHNNVLKELENVLRELKGERHPLACWVRGSGLVEWRRERGRNGSGDVVLLVRSEGWEVLSFEDVLRLLEFLFENEDRIYPKSAGFKGRDMLVEAVIRVGNGESWPQVLSDYRLAVRRIWLHELM